MSQSGVAGAGPGIAARIAMERNGMVHGAVAFAFEREGPADALNSAVG